MKVNPVAALILGAMDVRSLSQRELADRTGLTPKHINGLVRGHTGVSVDVALRLELALNLSAQWMLEQQNIIDLKAARAKLKRKAKR